MAVQDVPSPLVHRVSLNPGNETRKAKTRLEEIFEEREERAAKRYSAAELEKMAIESENETARLRGEPPRHKYYGGEGMTDEERAKKEEDEAKQVEQKAKLMASAKSLIDSGMEPAQVGQMLLGLPITGQPGSPTVTQGMTLKDVKEIIDMTTEKKEASELRVLIASLDKKIDDFVKGGGGKGASVPIDTATFAKQQADSVIAWHKALQEITPKAPPASVAGEPLVVVQEKNRHEEKMEEIKVEREYKESISTTLGEIPERIGYGYAARVREEGEGSSGDSGGLEYIMCTNEGCNTKIYITPDTGDQVTCPKCQMVYQRRQTAESKTE